MLRVEGRPLGEARSRLVKLVVGALAEFVEALRVNKGQIKVGRSCTDRTSVLDHSKADAESDLAMTGQ